MNHGTTHYQWSSAEGAYGVFVLVVYHLAAPPILSLLLITHTLTHSLILLLFP